MQPGYRPSYWELQTLLSPFDVLIVGGGIVGLNAAITILESRPQTRLAVVDRGVYPIGASTRNAGFACYGSLSEVASDVKSNGFEEAIKLFRKRKKGLDRLKEVVGESDIGFIPSGGSEIFLQEDHGSYEDCMAYLDQFNKVLRTEFEGDVFVPADEMISGQGLNGVAHLVSHPYEGQLHPGRLVKVLRDKASSLGAELLGGVDVEHIEKISAVCFDLIGKNGEVFKSREVLIANNGFAQTLLPELAVTPARNQILLTHPIQGLRLQGCFHYKEGYVYFRNLDDRILIGGARHLAFEEETTRNFGVTETIAMWLEQFLKEYIIRDFPGIEYSWSGIMGVGHSKEPIIKQMDDGMVVAVRLGGMGVAIGSLVGQDAAALVLKRL